MIPRGAKKPFSAAQAKSIYSVWTKLCLALFSTVRYTPCDTYIDFPQSVNSGIRCSKAWQHKASLRRKGCSGLSYSGIDEIPVSHLQKCKNAGK